MCLKSGRGHHETGEARLLELRKEANDEDRNSEVMQEIIKKNF